VQSKTLTQIIAEVRSASDTQSLTDRHPDADLTIAINDSIRSLRGLVTSRGFPYFLSVTTAATLAGTRVTGETYSVVPWPATAIQIHGIDVGFNSAGSDFGNWYPLKPITWAQRRDTTQEWRTNLSPGTVGAQYVFSVLTLPQGSGASTTPGTIALFPAADSGQYKIWFLTEFTDLTSSDVFLALPDWHEWIIQDVVEKLAQRDDDQHETAGIAAKRRAEADARMMESVPRVVSAGPLRPRRNGTRRRWSM